MSKSTNRRGALSGSHAIKNVRLALGALAATLCLGTASGSHAALTVFSAYDSGVFFGPNTLAAFGGFNAAVGSSTAITFESLAVGGANGALAAPGVTLASSGFNIHSGPTPGCLDIHCGGNVTPGGSKFALSVNRDSFLTFNFAAPITAFGAFFTGAQEFFDGTPSLVFDDLSGPLPARTTIAVPADRFGGMAFVGFNDPDARISSVTIRVPFDVLGVDEVRYAPFRAAVVPEPNTWAMMLVGFLGVGCILRRSSARSVH